MPCLRVVFSSGDSLKLFYKVMLGKLYMEELTKVYTPLVECC